MPAPESFAHAEERRLFYVALTRARQEVTIITSPSRISPFVVELLATRTWPLLGTRDSPSRSVLNVGRERWPTKGLRPVPQLLRLPCLHLQTPPVAIGHGSHFGVTKPQRKSIRRGYENRYAVGCSQSHARGGPEPAIHSGWNSFSTFFGTLSPTPFARYSRSPSLVSSPPLNDCVPTWPTAWLRGRHHTAYV